MKSNNIFLLGDLNCDLLGARERTDLIDNNQKTRKLLDLFDLFNMQNVVNEPTRVTPTTQSLIDLIVTTKVNLVGKSGALTAWVIRSLSYLRNSQAKQQKTPTQNYPDQKF